MNKALILSVSIAAVLTVLAVTNYPSQNEAQGSHVVTCMAIGCHVNYDENVKALESGNASKELQEIIANEYVKEIKPDRQSYVKGLDFRVFNVHQDAIVTYTEQLHKIDRTIVFIEENKGTHLDSLKFYWDR